jgi:hypothetical protein
MGWLPGNQWGIPIVSARYIGPIACRRSLFTLDMKRTGSQRRSLTREGGSAMTTLKYVGDLVVDSTGPLRKIHLPDGLYVVGEQMLIPADSEEEADDIIEQLKDE